ncbi:hypothetical protein STCU_08419 [Strigomonas culicis]|uniref:Uncharacterized protein n=1 Tax=Strigomonas culicis TaxID=28005 RepID=S9V4V9_9TRYP|nr:hypothetical protein STCU_08419 [Strigomonas culicis]|eukprot:EPY21956.1 hypothetical protein STCU_08419 [Strigomonas culicis]
MNCFPRSLDVTVQLVGTPHCHFDRNAALGLPATQVDEYCIRADRTGTVSLEVLLRYAFASTAEQKNFMDSSFYMREYDEADTTQEYYALNMSNANTAADGGMCTDAANRVSIGARFFTYHDMKGSSGGFTISASYNMSRQITLFATVFQFTRPERMAAHRQTFDPNTYMLNANGTVTYSVQFDLSTIPDDFIEGGRMYIEIGVSSTRLLDQVRVVRLHVDLDNWVTPAARFQYSKDRSLLYFCIMIVTLVTIVGLAFAVFWCCFKGSEDEEDTFIEKVAQRKEKKMH